MLQNIILKLIVLTRLVNKSLSNRFEQNGVIKFVNISVSMQIYTAFWIKVKVVKYS